MPDVAEQDVNDDCESKLAAIPDDVLALVAAALAPGEEASAVLYADIRMDGSFGESWVFLTDQRLLVLAPTSGADDAEVQFELPVAKIESAETRDYVGSSVLLVKSADRG